MSNQNNKLPPPNNNLRRRRRLACLDLMPEEYTATAQGLIAAAEHTPGTEADEYRRLANLFKLMAIALVFQEQMNAQSLENAETDLAAIGLPDIFVTT